VASYIMGTNDSELLGIIQGNTHDISKILHLAIRRMNQSTVKSRERKAETEQVNKSNES
jgi:hypothetical protein